MLEYSKLILNKVSFNSSLFEKELKKALSYLKPEEIEELFTYLQVNYSEYGDILNAVQEWFLK